MDLTGVWAAEHGTGLYYIQQLGTDIWWVGMSTHGTFHRGVEWTNIFHGHLKSIPNGPETFSHSIEGEWVDVPRGGTQQSGTLTIDATQVISQGKSYTELRKRPGTGGSFVNSFWVSTTPTPPPDLVFRMNHTRRNDKGSMHDHLKIYKDYTIVFGTVVKPISKIGYPANAARDYCSFIDAPWWDRGLIGTNDPPDGDIDFDVRISRDILDRQGSFWSPEGWYNNSDDIRHKLDNNTDKKQNWIHLELIMYGRNKDADHCHDTSVALFPGWQDSHANSVLINGRPINGHVEFGPPFRLLGQELAEGSHVRVTGFLALDCHHGDCSEGDPSNHNVEIHPVYSIDIRQDFRQPRSGANLTGVWHHSEVSTYYIRQIDNTIWWLGLSRDQGQTFANVFKGTLQGNTITGQWVDVPIGINGTRNNGTVSLTAADGHGALSTTLQGQESVFTNTIWIKLYDG